MSENSGDPFSCELCEESFTEAGGPRVPLVVPCGHSFCSRCLDSFELSNHANKRDNTCPKCRLPFEKVSSLVRNFGLLSAMSVLSNEKPSATAKELSTASITDLKAELEARLRLEEKRVLEEAAANEAKDAAERERQRLLAHERERAELDRKEALKNAPCARAPEKRDEGLVALSRKERQWLKMAEKKRRKREEDLAALAEFRQTFDKHFADWKGKGSSDMQDMTLEFILEGITHEGKRLNNTDGDSKRNREFKIARGGTYNEPVSKSKNSEKAKATRAKEVKAEAGDPIGSSAEPCLDLNASVSCAGIKTDTKEAGGGEERDFFATLAGIQSVNSEGRDEYLEPWGLFGRGYARLALCVSPAKKFFEVEMASRQAAKDWAEIIDRHLASLAKEALRGVQALPLVFIPMDHQFILDAKQSISLQLFALADTSSHSGAQSPLNAQLADEIDAYVRECNKWIFKDQDTAWASACLRDEAMRFRHPA